MHKKRIKSGNKDKMYLHYTKLAYQLSFKNNLNIAPP